MELFGQYIRAQRTRHLMSLRELSRRMNLSITYLSEFERGRTAISPDRLPLLAKALDMDLCELQAREAISRGRVLLSSSRDVWRRVEELQDAA